MSIRLIGYIAILLTGLTNCKSSKSKGNLGSSDDVTVKELGPAEELEFIKEAFAYATPLVKKQLPGLGRAWSGNVSGMGPTCDKVQQAYEIHVMQYIKKGGVKLRHYIPVVVFDAGNLPYDLAQHIYMGIGFKPAGMFDEPKLYGWIDPWRYGHTEVYLPGTGPNSPDQIIPMN